MDFLEELQQRVVLADGAMGTELLAGEPASADVCLEEWCLTNEEKVRAVHEAYLAAGARVIRTNSFGANAARLDRFGCSHRVGEINWTAAQLARDCAKGHDAIVAGSVGPLGRDKNAGQDRSALFTDQIGALLDGGVRVIFLETFLDLEELLIALEAKHSLHHCPVVCSLVPIGGDRLQDGTPLTEAFRRLRDAGADVVGVNCVTGAEAMTALSSVEDTDSLSALSSAGLPEMRDGRMIYPISPADFSTSALALVERGVRLIGGCCGAGPAHLRALATALHPAESPR